MQPTAPQQLVGAPRLGLHEQHVMISICCYAFQHLTSLPSLSLSLPLSLSPSLPLSLPCLLSLSPFSLPLPSLPYSVGSQFVNVRK